MQYVGIRRGLILITCVGLFFTYAFSAISYVTCINGYIDEKNSYSTHEYATLFYKGFIINLHCFLVSWGAFLERNRESLTAASTIVIAYFTFTLWRSTDGLHKAAILQSKDMQASINATLESAKATKDSAEATKDYVEAFINSKRAEIGMSPSAAWKGNIPTAKIAFTNIGEGNAAIGFTKIEIYFGSRLPAIRCFEYTTSRNEHQRILMFKEEFTREIVHKQALTDSEFAELEAGKKHVFIFGYVIYYDTFGNKIEKGFALRADFATKKFVKNGGKTYNYKKCTPDDA